MGVEGAVVWVVPPTEPWVVDGELGVVVAVVPSPGSVVVVVEFSGTVVDVEPTSGLVVVVVPGSSGVVVVGPLVAAATDSDSDQSLDGRSAPDDFQS